VFRQLLAPAKLALLCGVLKRHPEIAEVQGYPEYARSGNTRASHTTSQVGSLLIPDGHSRTGAERLPGSLAGKSIEPAASAVDYRKPAKFDSQSTNGAVSDPDTPAPRVFSAATSASYSLRLA